MSIADSPKSSEALFSNVRDAVRVLRGRYPKYSRVATPPVGPGNHRPSGIRTAADLNLATLQADEVPLLEKLVRQSQQFPGPIIEIGTLLGNTTTTIALNKAPAQKIVTVDLYCWNPWGLTPDAHFTLTRQMLRYLVEAGHVEQVRMDKNEFFRTYKGPAPSMVFLDAIHDYTETKKDILWAQEIGARIISGHDYSDQFPGVVEVVHEFGGPAELGGTVWSLPTSATKTSISVPATSQPLASKKVLELGIASIVIPAYNAKPFIGEALEDIEKQTYRSWEVIVVEDGTNDGTEAIVADFQKRNPDHRVVYERFPANRGVSEARNRAFELAQGDYIAFLDADDRWLPIHLETRIEQLVRQSADLAYGSVEMFDSVTDKTVGTWGPTPADLQNFPESLLSRTLLQPSGVVARTQVIRDVGNFQPSLQWAEDLDYWLRCAQQEKVFSYSETITSRYRKGVASAATSRMADCQVARAHVCKRFVDMFPTGQSQRKQLIAEQFLQAVSTLKHERRGKASRQLDKTIASLRWEAWKLQPWRVSLFTRALAGFFKSSFGKKVT